MANSANLTSRDTSSVSQQVSSGVCREWLYDGRIVVYTLANVHRSTIDNWFDAFKADILEWPSDQTFLVMHDLSSNRLDATPYARHRAHELSTLRPELHGKAAIVLPHTIAAAMIEVFVRVTQSKGTARVQRVFTSRDTAMAWLLE